MVEPREASANSWDAAGTPRRRSSSMKVGQRLLCAVVCVVAYGMLLGPGRASAADDGFVDIFNGKDLSGWVVEERDGGQQGQSDNPIWQAADGLLVCRGGDFGFLRYDKKLTDFIVHVEYRMSPGCNSGLGIRSVEFTGPRRTRPSFAGYEMQICDDAGKEPTNRSSGSLYRYVAPHVNASKPAGEWNTVEIKCRGTRIRITLNGQVIHDLDQTTIERIKDKPLSGYFSVQDHGRRIEFRNIRLKEL
jgi:hypothetical protein